MLAISPSGLWIYDINGIRRGLRELSLDWDSPDIANRSEFLPIQEISIPTFDDGCDVFGLCKKIDQAAIEKASAKPQDGFAQFSAAMAAIEERKLNAAKDYLNSVCDLLPHSLTVRLGRAHVLAELSDFEQAIQDTSFVIDHVDDEHARLMRLEYYFRNGQYEEAIRECDVCVERKIYDYSPSLRRASLKALGRIDETIVKRDGLPDSSKLSSIVDTISTMVGADFYLWRPASALSRLNELEHQSIEPNEENVFVRVANCEAILKTCVGFQSVDSISPSPQTNSEKIKIIECNKLLSSGSVEDSDLSNAQISFVFDTFSPHPTMEITAVDTAIP